MLCENMSHVTGSSPCRVEVKTIKEYRSVEEAALKCGALWSLSKEDPASSTHDPNMPEYFPTFIVIVESFFGGRRMLVRKRLGGSIHLEIGTNITDVVFSLTRLENFE